MILRLWHAIVGHPARLDAGDRVECPGCHKSWGREDWP